MIFSYLWDSFKFCLKKYAHSKKMLAIKPHSIFFIDGALQSHVDVGIVSTNCPPPSHSTAPPLPSDVEDHAHTPVHLSHSPNITSLNFHADLVVSPSSSHMHSILQPSSSHLGVGSSRLKCCALWVLLMIALPGLHFHMEPGS